jgi:hypothetical protein
LIIGQTLEDIEGNLGVFWRRMTSDSQLRWVGPEKGVIHMATGAVVNAVWDLICKVAGKPLWRYLSEMTPEQLVRCIDFRYISDAITPSEALEMLQKLEPTKAERIAYLEAHDCMNILVLCPFLNQHPPLPPTRRSLYGTSSPFLPLSSDPAYTTSAGWLGCNITPLLDARIGILTV